MLHHHISVTIIAYNEARRIEACLKSVAPVADEIIVVDSHSTDDTAAICRRYGARISCRRFSGYGAQRQFATSLASHSYVLSIDADEVLSPALQQSILKIKETGFTHRVYGMTRLNFYCGRPVRHCGWYPDMQVRLFDKRYANWNLRGVGERVIFPEALCPETLEGDILHYRCTTPQEYKAVELRHAALASRSIEGRVPFYAPFIKGAQAFLRMYLGCGAIFDGREGREISRVSYLSTYTAYNIARRQALRMS